MSNCATLLGFGPYIREDRSQYWTDWHILEILKSDIRDLQRQKTNPVIKTQLKLKKDMFLNQLNYIWHYAPGYLLANGLISEFTATRKRPFKEEPCNGVKWNTRQRALHEDAKNEYNTLLLGHTPSTVIRTEWNGDLYMSFEDALFWKGHTMESVLDIPEFKALVDSNPKSFVYRGLTIINNSICDMSWGVKSLDHILKQLHAKWTAWDEQILEIKNKNHKLNFQIPSHDFFNGLNFIDEIVLFDN